MSQNAIQTSQFNFPGQTNVYNGKVRDVYNISDKYLAMVVSDRISAFDVVLPRPIPYKGQVLNQIAAYFLDATTDIVQNWVLDTPDPNVTVGKFCEPYKVEMVIRGYLAGHAWREYRDGKRSLCGIALPDGLKENDRLPAPILTPTTKEDEGHDEDISREEIISQGLVDEAEYIKLEQYTRELFQRGTEMAADRGLILVDTKYEFGKHDGEIVLIDEINTPDSSRFFYLDGFDDRQARGEKQKQLSKEFVREWLMENGFQGQEGQEMPHMPDDVLAEVSEKYIGLYEMITGKSFVKGDIDNINERIQNNVSASLEKLMVS